MLCYTGNTEGVCASNNSSENFTYYGDSFTVNVVITDIWSDALNVNVSITNTGSMDIDNWALEFTFQQSPINSATHRVLSKNEVIKTVPFKFLNKSYTHRIYSAYTGSGMS